MDNSLHTISIHILDDDSLLNIFCLYRPFLLGEDKGEFDLPHWSIQYWAAGWWYKLAHVCRRWRNLILGSASYLRLSHVCRNRTPVADVLALSPPLPLTVDYRGTNTFPPEFEEGLMLALKQRNRIRHLRLSFPVQKLQKFLMEIDGDFPILECLIMLPWQGDTTDLMLRTTLQAPHLKRLVLIGFTCQIRPRLHPTAAGLVTLDLTVCQPLAYFQSNILLQWISCMPQLETLRISIGPRTVPNRDMERQLTYTPITTPITLPNLRSFWFQASSAYLEAILCRITAPRLERLQNVFSQQLTFFVSRSVHLIITTETSRSNIPALSFFDVSRFFNVTIYPYGDKTYAFYLYLHERHLDWQGSSMAQILNALSQVFSPVVHLVLRSAAYIWSPEEPNEVDLIEWRNLLRSFNNVKTLHVEYGLIKELSRCLRLEDGGLPLELLPELQKLAYSGLESGDTSDAFTSFIEARQNAGRSVTLICLGSRRNLTEFKVPVTTLRCNCYHTLVPGCHRRTPEMFWP